MLKDLLVLVKCTSGPLDRGWTVVKLYKCYWRVWTGLGLGDEVLEGGRSLEVSDLVHCGSRVCFLLGETGRKLTNCLEGSRGYIWTSPIL